MSTFVASPGYSFYCASLSLRRVFTMLSFFSTFVLSSTVFLGTLHDILHSVWLFQGSAEVVRDGRTRALGQWLGIHGYPPFEAPAFVFSVSIAICMRLQSDMEMVCRVNLAVQRHNNQFKPIDTQCFPTLLYFPSYQLWSIDTRVIQQLSPGCGYPHFPT
jgi:hypothetical protein